MPYRSSSHRFFCTYPHLIQPSSHLLSERLLDFRGQDVDALFVLAAHRDDDVGEAFSGFDEALVHRLHIFLIMKDRLVEAASALVHITLDDSDEALVGAGIHIHLEVEDAGEGGIGEDEDAFHDEHLGGIDGDGLLPASAGDVGVGGHLHGAAVLEFFNVLNQEREFDGGGMVEIDGFALFLRQFTVVAVVGVLRKHADLVLRKGVDDSAHHGSFSRSGTSGNTNH